MINTPASFALSVFFLLSQAVSYAQTEKAADDEFAQKKTETKLTEVVVTDSLPASELLKRAVNWIKMENPKYKKTSGTTTAAKAECIASFPVKPKELNPGVDYSGKITMKVVIECKDSKYRYIVSDIKHISKNGLATAGSIDNKVPECGSMSMDENCWKKLRGEALKNAALVVSDLKDGMFIVSSQAAKEEW
jgi:hypothetical protein